jgi:hypothetical protein
VARIACLLSVLAGCGDGSNAPAANPNSNASLTCAITFSVPQHVTFKTLQALVDFSAAPGSFVADARNVHCDRLVTRVLTQTVLSCSPLGTCPGGDEQTLLVSINGGATDVVAPRDLVRCEFLADAEPDADDFDVIYMEAGDSRLAVISPPPDLVASEITCRQVGATTSTTTTTLAECDDSECPEGEHCALGECMPAGRYEIEFSLLDPVEFGALQIATYYDCADGDIVGDNFVGTSCVANPALNMSASFSDRVVDGDECTGTGAPGLGNFAAGVITGTASESGPVTLFRCVYQSHDGAPTVDDFPTEVVDSVHSDLTPIVPPPTIAVTAIRMLTRP